MHLKPTTTGLVLGTFLGGMHLAWSLLVLIGWAQPLLNFIFMLHMITPPYTVESFDVLRAGGLVVVTAAIGFCVGNVFARLWNKLHRA